MLCDDSSSFDRIDRIDSFLFAFADVCGLDKDRGTGRNFTVKWFFDMEYGGCSRFWFGGGGGNANQFATQDECKAHCVEPTGFRNPASFIPLSFKCV